MRLKYLEVEIVTLSLKYEDYVDVFSFEGFNTVPESIDITYIINL